MYVRRLSWTDKLCLACAITLIVLVTLGALPWR